VDTHTDTQTNGRDFLNYAGEMGSGAVICVPSFIMIGSAIQKLIGGIHRQQSDLISLLYFWPTFLLCVCVCVCVFPFIVARQRLGENLRIFARQRLSKNPIVARLRLGGNVTAVTNTHAK
jgi:hypothetical protein